MDPQFAEVSAAFHTEIKEIKMINAGTIGMPLHFGRVPGFLTERMGKMGDAIVESIIENYGKSEVLTRMSDPNWFQAFGAVMGMHWNSSGVTATVLGALQRRINPKARSLGLYILGGKGRCMARDVEKYRTGLSNHGLPGGELIRACDLTRRVDNNAVQDGYGLYQQYFILSDEVVDEHLAGMNRKSRRARRYHWHSLRSDLSSRNLTRESSASRNRMS